MNNIKEATPIIYIGYDEIVGGIGDFVYILFQFYCYCHVHNIRMGVYIPKKHPLSFCLYNSGGTPSADIPVIRNVCDGYTVPAQIIDHIHNRKSAVIYTNMIHYLHLWVRYMNPQLRELLRQSFVSKVLCYTHIVNNNIMRLYKFAKFTDGYCAIHIRCGDKYLSGGVVSGDNRCVPFSAEMDTRVRRIVDFFTTQGAGASPPPQIVLFCDYEEYKTYLVKKFGLYCFDTEIIHTGSGELSQQRIQPYIDSFSEFILLGRASVIFSMTVSNFSRVNSFINDVPLYSFNEEDEIIQHFQV